jgi:thymidylate kinase
VILLLDGLNGTGKTTLAKQLSEWFGLPICRVFRRPDNKGGDVHWGAFHQGVSRGSDRSTETQLLTEAGVPFNTFVDDLYTADIVAKLRPPGLILDRSMPSSLVYGTVRGEPVWQDSALAERVWRYWESLLLEYGAPVHYFMLTGDYENLRARCYSEDRWHPDREVWSQYDGLYRRTALIFRVGQSHVLDSTIQNLEALFNRIVSVVEGGACPL